MEVELKLRHPVDLGDYLCPADLHQGTDQGPKPDQFIARAGPQPDRGAPRIVRGGAAALAANANGQRIIDDLGIAGLQTLTGCRQGLP